MNSIKSILAISTAFLLLTECGCVGNVANAELTPEKTYGQTESDISGDWLILVILEGKYVQGITWQMEASDRFKAEMYVSAQKDDLSSGFYWWIFRDEIVHSKGYEPEKEYVSGKIGVSIQKPDTDIMYGVIGTVCELEPMNASWFWNFVKQDLTNEIPYDRANFDCDDFVRVFEENIEAAGGDAGAVYECNTNSNYAHMISYVNIEGNHYLFEPFTDEILPQHVTVEVLYNAGFDEMEVWYQGEHDFVSLYKSIWDFPLPLD